MRRKTAAVFLFTILLCSVETARAGNPYMDEIVATRTPAEIAYAQKWDCLAKSPQAHSIAEAPFKFVGSHVCLQGYVGQPFSATEFNLFDVWPIGGDQSQATAVVVIGDARNLSQNQYVEVYGTVRKPRSGTTSAGGNALFAVVKADIVDDRFSALGKRK